MRTRRAATATAPSAPDVPRNVILEGDALQTLRTLPSRSVQCVITSPPYYNLRNYNCEGQIGLEATLDDYLARLVAVFDEVYRVLRPDGVCWLNIGDSYAADRGYQVPDNKHKDVGNNGAMRVPHGLKPKDLMMVPFRLALALQAAGWWVRQTIIWSKPAPMPESVTDRCTTSHEYIFLLTRSERYYYDADAIREPQSEATLYRFAPGQSPRKPRGPKHEHVDRLVNAAQATGDVGILANGRNRRSVWTVNTEPFPDAHYAVFPTALVTPMVLAGTSPQACEQCGAPWERVVERNSSVGVPRGSDPSTTRAYGKQPQRARILTNTHTRHWRPSCRCKGNTGAGRCLILDPFAGSGTVGVVASQHGRDYLGIELNHEYADMARRRIAEEGRPVVLPRKQRQQMRTKGVAQASLLDSECAS